jgi:hypothetical protein
MHAVYPVYRQLLLSFLIALRTSTSFHRCAFGVLMYARLCSRQPSETASPCCCNSSTSETSKSTGPLLCLADYEKSTLEQFCRQLMPTLGCVVYWQIFFEKGRTRTCAGVIRDWLQYYLETSAKRTHQKLLSRDWLQYYLETDAPEVAVACLWGCVKLWSVFCGKTCVFPHKRHARVSYIENKNLQTSGSDG